MNKIKKIVAVALALTVVVWTAPTMTSAATTADLQAQIATLLAQISSLQSQLGTTTTGTTTTAACFTKNLTVGSKGAEVTLLQQKLGITPATGYFGPMTKKAVLKFQKDNGIAQVGNVGPMTRAKLNALYCAATTTTTTGTTTTTTTTTGTTVVATGTGLTVSAGTVIPSGSIVTSNVANGGGATMYPMLNLNFTAGSDGAVKVTDIKLARGGVSSNTDISNVQLFDGATKVADMKSITSDNVVTFSNSDGLFTVAAGTTKTITVTVDIASNVSAGKTIGFSLVNASSITAGSASVAGVFPVVGNQMTVAQVSDLGTFTVGDTSITSNAAIDPSFTNKTDLVRMNATCQYQRMSVSYAKFNIIGTADATDFKDVTLSIGSQTWGPVQVAADKTVTFDMSSNPYNCDSGTTKTLILSGYVIGGASRNFYVAIQEASNFLVKDLGYNINARLNKNDTFGVVKSSTTTNINQGNLTVTRATDSPTGDTVKGGVNVVLARYNFSATDKVKVLAASAKATLTGSNTLKNVKLYVNGSQIGITDTTMTGNGTDTASWGSFGNSFIIESGTSAVVEVRADLTDSAITSGDTVAVTLTDGGTSSAYQKMTSGDYGDISDTPANTLTIRSGAATLSLNSSLPNGSSGSPTAVAGQTTAQVCSAVVTAGTGEPIDLSQIIIEDVAGTAPTYYTNLKLMQGTTQIGQTYGTLTSGAGTTYSFVPSGSIKIAAGQQMVFDCYADIKPTASGATTQFTAYKVYATGDTTSQAADSTGTVALQVPYVAGQGSLAISTGADTPNGQQFVFDKRYRFLAAQFSSAQAEGSRISEVNVSVAASGSGADAADLSEFNLYDVTNGAKTLIAGPVYSVNTTDATTGTGYVTFNGFNYTVPKGSMATFAVEAKLTSWATGRSGDNWTFKILDNFKKTPGYHPVIAYGDKSNATLTVTVNTTVGNQMSGFRAVPGISLASFSPNNVKSPTHELARFVVSNETNEGGYSLWVKGMKVTVNASNLSEPTVAATTTRIFSLYKDNITSSGNMIAQLTMQCAKGSTCTYGGGYLNFATTSSTKTGFNNYTVVSGSTVNLPSTGIEIASGGSKTFILVADTSLPSAGSNTLSTVSVGLGESTALTWYDGEATTSSTNGLPLSAYSTASWY